MTLRRAAFLVAWLVVAVAAIPALVMVSAIMGIYALVEVAYGVVWLVALFVRFALGMRSP